MVVPKSVLPQQELFYIINPSQNYAAYRQQFNAQPGIPYLLPHIREGKGKQVLLELFQKVVGSTTR